MADLDEPHHLQRGERLAHRAAADAELLGEFALGHQAVARLELLDVDELAQPVDDQLVQGRAGDRLQLGAAHGRPPGASSGQWPCSSK